MEINEAMQGRNNVIGRRYVATAKSSCNQKPAEQWREDFSKCGQVHGTGDMS